jgi:putative restriction endonuclease
MKMYIGVTDYNWFNLLKANQPQEINFWQPNSSRTFRAVREGELFFIQITFTS